MNGNRNQTSGQKARFFISFLFLLGFECCMINGMEPVSMEPVSTKKFIGMGRSPVHEVGF